MAKADFCFNFYDGDATRDMAHMNRLERGAYTDVLIQQRQRGHLSLDDLKKFLSKDFDCVWGSLEWILKKDTAGKYFIEWLENSEIKAKAHSLRQSENRAKAEEKKKSDQSSTNTPPTHISGQPPVEPLEDGNGNEDEDGIEDELKRAFDEIYIEQLRPKWKMKDFELELSAFIDKVRGSPEHYKDHDSGGLRLAFQSQLRYAKDKKDVRQSNKADAGVIKSFAGVDYSADL